MKRSLLIFVLFLPVCLNAQLKINELMPKNISANLDDAYNYSMWVELYNTSATSSENLLLYTFTDDLKVPRKWRPVAKSVGPRSYTVLWFERPENDGHSTFELEPEGGSLYLLDNSLRVVDSVRYPRQFRNISFGRKIDAGPDWVFFEQFSPGQTNNNKKYSSERCDNPVFSLRGGYYTSAQKVDFETPADGDTIYYSTNGTEPTRASTRYIPGNSIPVALSTTKVIRARTFSKEKLSSDVVTSTYFANTREHHLPVVSIVTAPANLTDNTIGIYVTGTNGIKGDNPNIANYNQPWERPVNYELFDTAHATCLNQELDIAITGAYSRTFPLKPLKIKPDSKFGDGRLRYDFFPSAKPNLRYKDIMMRNSGNDFFYSMMRDGFNQTLAMHRMDIDLLGYQPAVLYMNGDYYGILNLREETGKSYFYSNYGLDGDEVYEIDKTTIATDTCFGHLRDYISNKDITTDAVYSEVGEMMDLNEFINYHIAEIFIANWDWPWNNVKIWKKLDGGKWRWLTYDTDWAFNYSNNQQSYNTLLYVLGEHPSDRRSDWSNLLIRRLKLNKTFCKTFVDRFCVQISSTFRTERVDAIMDSLSAKISDEIIYHKAKWGGSQRTLVNDLKLMKQFSAQRPDYMMGFLSERFANGARIQTVNLSSNIPGVTYRMNSEPVLDSRVSLKYFSGWNMSLEASPVFGYKFKHWEISRSSSQELVKMGDTWNYYDKNAIPAANWYTSAYSDTGWSSGKGQFGYGGKGEVTTLSYGGNASSKYPTAYFRKTISITGLDQKNKFSLTAYLDDGAVIYVNGHEVGRYLIADGEVGFETFTTAKTDGAYVTFDVPQAYLQEGENLIAVEVHQVNAASSDLIFDLRMSCNLNETTSEISTDPIFSRSLTSDMNLKAVFEESTIVVPDDEATVVFNELVSDNDTFMDEFGVKEDYIELYNKGDKAVNIAGWYLTDISVNRTLCQIPTSDLTKTLIPAKGRLILWADKEPLQGLLHVGLKLSKDGETLILSRKNSLGNLVTVDSVICPALEKGLSYSCIPDGSGNWLVEIPTFNAKNNDFTALVEKPRSTIELYPTLVSETFTVQNAAGLNLTLTDLSGKTVHRSTCQSEVEIIPAADLQKGMYLVTVGAQRFKIIKR